MYLLIGNLSFVEDFENEIRYAYIYIYPTYIFIGYLNNELD